MNLRKRLRLIVLIITFFVMFFCCPQIYAYYSTNDSKSVTIETKNLAPSLAATTVNKEDTTCTVIVKGVSSVLENIKETSIRAYVDLSEYTRPGVYDVKVIVEGDNLNVTYDAKVQTIQIKIK